MYVYFIKPVKNMEGIVIYLRVAYVNGRLTCVVALSESGCAVGIFQTDSADYGIINLIVSNATEGRTISPCELSSDRNRIDFPRFTGVEYLRRYLREMFYLVEGVVLEGDTICYLKICVSMDQDSSGRIMPKLSISDPYEEFVSRPILKSMLMKPRKHNDPDGNYSSLAYVFREHQSLTESEMNYVTMMNRKEYAEDVYPHRRLLNAGTFSMTNVRKGGRKFKSVDRTSNRVTHVMITRRYKNKKRSMSRNTSLGRRSTKNNRG